MNLNVPFEKLDDYIRTHFKCSYMSNSKWKKLINQLGEEFPDGFVVVYKLIHGDELLTRCFQEADEQFFIEPILYKEVEWIEFPDVYQDWINPDNKKAGKATRTQDLSRINEIVNSSGTYECKHSDQSIRIYGYR